jgi:hypothetical protein
MVGEGIVLGHLISERGIEIDRAKIEVIEQLSPPINVKGIRRFLGHAGFYRRFIKDFSHIARPLTNLLASKMLTGPQLNYATTEKERLAVVYAIDKFRSYLV